ncbi:hypothetical protein [Arthrobacter agilis]|uniref:hypothetical protein n=1 Tax=Arthrobacter agilis TaxID=37921 RepID=UPI002789C742|nr:hypothetical protein [Arthrobacter agilis]MDQ0735299.1 hypothetical protein [Arthrobacter agilis]
MENTTSTSALDVIRARADAATEGPWEVEPGSVSADFLDFKPSSVFVGGGVDPFGEANNDYVLSYNVTDEDAEFIAHARTDVPKLVSALEAVLAEHRKVSIYDECECPDGTHPEDYDYIDCQDYAGCHNSITGIGCEECCVHGDYLTEACGESHSHTTDATQRCATVKAITEALA